MAKKILAVDDSPTVRTSIKLALEGAGFELEFAGDGSDALDKVKKEKGKFDLIITDLNMPQLDGICFIRAVRNMPEYRYTPILMLTTESQTVKKEEGKKAGATGWIVKPFKAEQLLAVIQRVIRA